MNAALNSQLEQDNPWKMALEGSGVGVWDWNIATGAQTHSAHWEEMLGFRAGELNRGYQDFAELVHPDDLLRVQTAARDYMEGRAPTYSEDFRMRCKDGSWKWILTRGTVVQWDATGAPLRMIGTHTDISERKRAEEDLRTLNARLEANAATLQTTLASMSQGIVLVDSDGRIQQYNARASELLNLPESLLAEHPLVADMIRFQFARGDFGTDAEWVSPEARGHLMQSALDAAQNYPEYYLRTDRKGRTLEVRTKKLPDGGFVRTYTDVTAYVQAEAEREHLNQLLDATQAIAMVGGWERDFVNGKVFWTEGVYRILELTPAEFTPTDLASTQRFFTPESQAKIRAVPPATGTHAVTSHDMELEMITGKGRHIFVRIKGTTSWSDGRPQKRTSVLQDITERKQVEAALRESEERWKLALDSTGDGVWDWYVQTGAEFFSPRLLQMCGYEAGDQENVSSEFDDRTHPDDMEALQRARADHFEGRTPAYYIERRIRCKDGSWKWVLSRGMVISRDEAGRPLRMIGTFTDITSRKEAEALIRRQAYYDTLTGLPNRRMLRDRLEQDLKKCNRDASQLALLFIDLDHFKEVNDTLGHDQGDLLLVEAGRRIQASVRQSDTVARMGGDEFTVILSELGDDIHLEGILQKILQTLGQVFQLGSEQVFVSASIGIALYPLDADHIEDLLKAADQALYAAKGAGRNRFSFFTPALQEAAQTRVRLAGDLRTALQNGQFRLAYQPIVSLTTGDIHKAEALIRWDHPSRGAVSPATFIPIAESSGLIVEIGEWVFQQATAQVRTWRQHLSPRFQISVNKSPVQFHHDDGARAPWTEQLRAQGLPGDAITVEITEGLLLNTTSQVAETLLALRDGGVRVSLDDFGTGYSSLSYLQKYDIDFIKIDQSFVRHLIPDSTDLALCKAIVVMAHALGIQVIAEGVETELQRDLLASIGCDFAQGYFYARPMPAEAFEAFMASYTPIPPSWPGAEGR